MTVSSSSNATASVPSFVFPVLKEDKDFIITNFIQDDAQEISSSVSFEELDLPFGNIPRGDRIGRIADWTGASADTAQQRGGARRVAAITNTHSKAEEEAEGWSFSLGNASVLAGGFSRRPAAANKPVRPQVASGPTSKGPAGQYQKDGRGPGRRFGPGGWSNRPVDRIREPSIKVGQDWKLVEEIEFSRLAKVQINVEEPSVLTTCGSAKVYDRSNDKLKAKAEKLYTGSVDSISVPVSASNDAYIQECFAKNEATIFTTDVVASLLMSCQRSVQPWDIVVKRRGQAVFFDARPGSSIHLTNVSENAGEAAPEDNSEGINSQANLAMEATKINAGLPEFLGKGQESVAFEGSANSGIGKAYRYSKFNLGESFDMVVRSELGNVLGGDDLALSKAFLEYDHSSFGWRSKLDTSRGAVLAHEMKHNGAVLSRWIYQAIYSGSTSLKLAYISRVNPKNPTRHSILGVHDFNPYDLATQMNLNVANGFGMIRALADLCLGLPENQDFALVRDANKPMLRLYTLPSGSH